MSNNRIKRRTKKPVEATPSGNIEVVRGNVEMIEVKLLNSINANLRELISLVKENKWTA